MYFLFDSKEGFIAARKSRGELARYILNNLGITVEKGSDPVQLAHEHLPNTSIILTLSKVFEVLAESNEAQAKFFATQCKGAVDSAFE